MYKNLYCLRIRKFTEYMILNGQWQKPRKVDEEEGTYLFPCLVRILTRRQSI